MMFFRASYLSDAAFGENIYNVSNNSADIQLREAVQKTKPHTGFFSSYYFTVDEITQREANP